MNRLPCLLAIALVFGVPSAGAVPVNVEGLSASDEVRVGETRAQAATPCVGGFAGSYPCNEVDLLAFLPLNSIGGIGEQGNDCWGWTDPQTGKEYALMGLTHGTSFVDISDPENPLYLGFLPTQSGSAIHRDVKTYADHAFIVSEALGHGMQVFDLTRLRNVTSPPDTFTPDATYGSLAVHNIVIDESTGYAFLVGANGGANTCGGGLHIVNISNPTSPAFAGCFSADGYTHDAQCVVYDGPDPDHQGREVCFNCNEDTVTIADVTNKAAPTQISRSGYPGVGYTHQGWLTEDKRYFLVGDEADEISFGHNTRTYIWDVSDLDAPSLLGSYFAGNPAIDHNLYVSGDFAFAANYRSGLRILDLVDISTASLSEVAYFDIYPANNDLGYNGAWSCYPFFESGVVIVSGREQGLFILQPTGLSDATSVAASGDGRAAGLRVWPNPSGSPRTVEFSLTTGGRVRISVFDAAGRRVTDLADGARSAGSHEVTWRGRDENGRSLPAGTYFLRLETEDGIETRKITLIR